MNVTSLKLWGCLFKTPESKNKELHTWVRGRTWGLLVVHFKVSTVNSAQLLHAIVLRQVLIFSNIIDMFFIYKAYKCDICSLHSCMISWLTHSQRSDRFNFSSRQFYPCLFSKPGELIAQFTKQISARAEREEAGALNMRVPAGQHCAVLCSALHNLWTMDSL